MSTDEFKISKGVVYPPPPTLASNEEFATGTSESASPSVKQVKDEFDIKEQEIKTWVSTQTQTMLSDALPAGSIIAWLTETPPQNYLKMDGSAVSRTTYSKLFTVIGTTYGAGDGSTTFNLPNATDRVLQMSGGRGAVGVLLNESLPNITGEAFLGARTNFGLLNEDANPPTGSIYRATAGLAGHYNNGGTGGTNSFALGFSASRSSSTYQDNAPVQQNALVCCFCIKYQ